MDTTSTATASAPRVAVVVGSTRPGRISLDVAHWVRDVIAEDSELCYEIVDLAEIDLPMLDEPLPAAFGQYEHTHTRNWSALVSGFDAFLFVYPQYNWGYPGVLKNALDFLYAEWHGKPASLFTWSITGGARGADQLYQVLQGLHMQPIRAHVEAPFAEVDVDEHQQLINAERTFGRTRTDLATINDGFASLTARLHHPDPAN